MKINAAGLEDTDVAKGLVARANEIVAQAEKEEREILEIVETKINKQ